MPVIDYSDKELIKRALLASRLNGSGESLRWAAVSQNFSLGSSYAIELCRIYGIDPFEKIDCRKCESCEP